MREKFRGWMEEILRLPETEPFLFTQGAEPWINSTEATGALLRAESEKWKYYVEAAKIEPQ